MIKISNIAKNQYGTSNDQIFPSKAIPNGFMSEDEFLNNIPDIMKKASI